MWSLALSVQEENALLAALQEKVTAGWQALQDEPAFLGIQDTIHFVNGAHGLVESNALSKVHLNRVRKIHSELAAVLTDVRPYGSYETQDDNAKLLGEALSNCNTHWWRTSRVDRTIREALSFAGVGASGYVLLQHIPDKDDIVASVVDPRDVVPIEPVNSVSIQDWRGACIRIRMPLSDAHRRFPEKRAFLKESRGNGWFGPETSRVAGAVRQVWSSFWDSVLNRKRRVDPPGVEIMLIHYRDDSVNKTDAPIEMGEPGTNWAYTVQPGERMFPRGHVVICTPDTILWNGPNRYWHGKIPLVKFTFVTAPWTILGLSIIQDILPLQHSLNESVRGLDDARNKILRRDVIADQKAMPESELKKIDTRMPGGTYWVSTQLTGSEGFRFGEPPDLGPYYLQYMQFILDQMDDVSGVRGIQAFQQLKQMPSSNTIEQFLNAMSPILRDMARNLEASVAELEELMLFNFLQFYSTEKRREILGADGLAGTDFEGEPGTMVPAGVGTLEERARNSAKQFKFAVAPNTFLNINNITARMMKYQLWSQGGLSTRTIWEAFDIPNIGKAHGATEAEQMMWERENGLLQGPTRELVQVQLEAQKAAALAQAAQAQAAVAQMGMQAAGAPPQVQAAPEGAAPGGGAPRGPGRPPEGIEAPQLVTRDGGTRQVVSRTGG